MINLTLLDLARTILSVKLVYVLIGIVALVVVGFAIYGVVKLIQEQKERQNNLKFAPLAFLGSGVSLKLIIYVLAFAMIGATAFGLYRKITESSTTTNYKNEVSRVTGTVSIDQRQVAPEKKYLIRLELLGLDIHFFETTPKTVATIDNNKVIVTPAPVTPNPVVPVPPAPTPQPEKKTSNTIMNVVKIVTGVTIVVFAVHFITKLFKKE
jgi:hypothetical protein